MSIFVDDITNILTMPKGQLFINGVDVSEFGMSMDSSALSALMSPPPKKDWVTNAVRGEAGERYLKSDVPKCGKRELSLTFNLVAPDEETFFERYAKLCALLDGGVLNLRTSFQPSVVYRCVYVSISQFSEFRREMASFALSLVEPDPTDRKLDE